MKKIIALLALSLSASSSFASTVVSCSKAEVFSGESRISRKPFNFRFNLTIENGKNFFNGNVGSKKVSSDDIFIQNWGRQEARAFRDLNRQMGAGDLYKDMITADTYDVNSNPRIGLIVSKDKQGKVNKVHFTIGDDQSGICR